MYVGYIYIQCRGNIPLLILLIHTYTLQYDKGKMKTWDSLVAICTSCCSLSLWAKARQERGEQWRLGAVLQINIKDVCLLSSVHMYVNNRRKKNKLKLVFSANVELFDLL